MIFFADNMVIYIEKEIAENFNLYSIIDGFKHMKEQMTILQICIISLIVMVILNYEFIIFTLVIVLFWLSQKYWSRSASGKDDSDVLYDEVFFSRQSGNLAYGSIGYSQYALRLQLNMCWVDENNTSWKVSYRLRQGVSIGDYIMDSKSMVFLALVKHTLNLYLSFLILLQYVDKRRRLTSCFNKRF